MKQDYGSMEEAIWDLYGNKVSILREEPVYGGDINDACKITLSTGQKVFVKRNSAVNHKFFTTEALGLYALKETGEIGVPEILAGGVDVAKGISFLMMEYLESVSKREDYWETFGHQLAMVHQAECRYFVNSKEGCYGFLEDNFIGAAPQKIRPKETGLIFTGSAGYCRRFRWQSIILHWTLWGNLSSCWSIWKIICGNRNFHPFYMAICGAEM